MTPQGPEIDKRIAVLVEEAGASFILIQCINTMEHTQTNMYTPAALLVFDHPLITESCVFVKVLF